MISACLEESLGRVELCFNDVSAALVGGDPEVLVRASAALQQTAFDFSALLECLTPADLQNKDMKSRLKNVAEGLALRRESLIRRTAWVERALNAVVPATQSATYSRAGESYGRPARQTGAFKVLAA